MFSLIHLSTHIFTIHIDQYLIEWRTIQYAIDFNGDERRYQNRSPRIIKHVLESNSRENSLLFFVYFHPVDGIDTQCVFGYSNWPYQSYDEVKGHALWRRLKDHPFAAFVCLCSSLHKTRPPPSDIGRRLEIAGVTLNTIFSRHNIFMRSVHLDPSSSLLPISELDNVLHSVCSITNTLPRYSRCLRERPESVSWSNIGHNEVNSLNKTKSYEGANVNWSRLASGPLLGAGIDLS